MKIKCEELHAALEYCRDQMVNSEIEVLNFGKKPTDLSYQEQFEKIKDLEFDARELELGNYRLIKESKVLDAVARLRTVIACNDVSEPTYDDLKAIIDLLIK